MALTPTSWTERTMEGYLPPVPLEEGVAMTTFREGFYQDPSMRGAQLIERIITSRNTFGHVMYRLTERWDYATPNGAPTRYTKLTEGKVFLPVVNVGRALIKLEEDVTVFWTFCPWSKDALGFRREVNAWIVYDLKPVADLDPIAEAAANAKGIETLAIPDDERRLVIDNARIWSEAVGDRTIVESVNANQTCVYKDAVIVEETDVVEEVDRWSITVMRKNTIRADDNSVTGPTYIQKESHSYALSVPVEPPTITAHDADIDGIRLNISGGGAKIEVPLQTGGRTYTRHPELYRVYRKKITEPERTASGDPYRIHTGTTPVAPPRRFLGSDWVKGYDGVDDATSDTPGLPASTSYVEPHDPDPVDPDSWRHVGDTPNDNDGRNTTGVGVLFDLDVELAGVYQYAAVAVVQRNESPLSNVIEVTRSTGSARGHSISVIVREDGSIEADYVTPNDPAAFPGGVADFGETIIFDVPALLHTGTWPERVIDSVQATSSTTADTDQFTANHTPRNVEDEWAAGRRCRIIDRVGAGRRTVANNLTPWSVLGTIVEMTPTSTTIITDRGDGHEYPIGADVELLHETQDARYDHETGDLENDGTIEALVLAIGRRQGLKNSRESFRIRATIDAPIIGLRDGQYWRFADIAYEAFGNDLWLKSRVEEVPWLLTGWSMVMDKMPDGSWRTMMTDMTLEER